MSKDKIVVKIQNDFLNQLRKEKIEVSLYLANGIRLIDVITGFDQYVIVLGSGSLKQLVFKNNMGTIVPKNFLFTPNMSDGNESLSITDQDEMLRKFMDDGKVLSVYLISGIKLDGMIVGFDTYVIFLSSNNVTQMIYKHSITTIRRRLALHQR